ncbi:DUF5776 domain-containing protein [Levilactobacillus fuyuanensis]|uniref:DUF5776 domain-containing protein n=1 Tax=Levilactobacillus fuyuanensis TaxID=2486022 RepID=A0ABW4H2S0_9LACO|nr:DUF5776 domain-containing protein [Levilactobacillus fuyuanensis]
MKTKFWVIPFLLFSATLITTVNQPATSVRADTQASSTTNPDNSAGRAMITNNTVVLPPYDLTKVNSLLIGGQKSDLHPVYGIDGASFDGGDMAGGDQLNGASHAADNILINVDTGDVYYGFPSGNSHLDTDIVYIKYDSATMILNGAKTPVKVTLNFRDASNQNQIIQTRTIDAGIGADDPLFGSEIKGLVSKSVPIDGYTARLNSTTSEINKTDNTATINYFYTNDKATSTPSTPTNTTSTPTTTSSSASDAIITSAAGDKVSATTKPVAAKHSAIYGVKKIGFYNNPTFSKATRLHWYTKQTRPNRPQFVVTGYARSKAGTLRYHVRAANGKTGYVTANSQYVVNTYYKSQPKTIRVIGKHGINAYNKVTLNGKVVRHYKRGTTLTIKKIQKHNLTSRLVLSNGTYITGNKTLVIAK